MNVVGRMNRMMEYSDEVMDHFMNPRNVGELEDPDGIGRVGNPTCGDIMEFQIKVEDERISDVRFRTFGCGAAIAVSSMVSEMAKDKTLDEAMKITNRMVADKLGGLPKNKFHCSNLGADALHEAIENYRNKGAEQEVISEKQIPEPEGEKQCHCPHCDVPVHTESAFCKACGAKLRFCAECGCVIPRTVEQCPECDAKLSPVGD